MRSIHPMILYVVALCMMAAVPIVGHAQGEGFGGSGGVTTFSNQTITGIKTMTGANVITHANTGCKILDTDATHQLSLKWNANSASNSTLNIPAHSSGDVVVTTGTTQTLDAKTLNAPTISGGSTDLATVINGSILQLPALDGAGAGYGLLQYANSANSRTITFPDPGGSDSVIYAAATQTLTGKTIGVSQLSGAVAIANGGTNNGSLGVSAVGIYNGDGSKIVQTTGSALQQFRVNAGGTAIEAFTPSSGGFSIPYALTSSVGTGADTNETDGATYTIPGGTLASNGQAVRFRVVGGTGSNGNNKTVKLYFGSSNFYTAGPSAANNANWYFDANIIRAGAASQQVWITGYWNGAQIAPWLALTMETLSGDLVIKNTMTNGTASASDVSTWAATVEILK